jgi:hypothetical protein
MTRDRDWGKDLLLVACGKQPRRFFRVDVDRNWLFLPIPSQSSERRFPPGPLDKSDKSGILSKVPILRHVR